MFIKIEDVFGDESVLNTDHIIRVRKPDRDELAAYYDENPPGGVVVLNDCESYIFYISETPEEFYDLYLTEPVKWVVSM